MVVTNSRTNLGFGDRLVPTLNFNRKRFIERDHKGWDGSYRRVYQDK